MRHAKAALPTNDSLKRSGKARSSATDFRSMKSDRRYLLGTILFITITTTASRLEAAIGDRDTSWGSIGTVEVTLPDSPTIRQEVQDLYPKPQGGLLVITTQGSEPRNFNCFNFNRTGSLDLSSSPTGIVNLGVQNFAFTGQSPHMDGTGRITGQTKPPGYPYSGIFRLLPNGTLDPDFGVGGKLTTQSGPDVLFFSSIGTAWMISSENGWIRRLQPNFFTDPTFNKGGQGIGVIWPSHLVEMTDGRVLLGHGNVSASTATVGVILQSFLATGQKDAEFNPSNGNGFLTISRPVGSGQLAFSILDAQGMPDGSLRLLCANGHGQLERFTVSRTGVVGPSTVSPSFFDWSVMVPTAIHYAASGRIYVIFDSESKIAVLNDDLSLDGAVGLNGIISVSTASAPQGSPIDYWRFVRVPAARPGQGGLPPFYALEPDNRLARYQGETDADSDGVPDRDESGGGGFVSIRNTGSSPTEADSDGDGLDDGLELYIHSSNPNLDDSDGDGFKDGFEVRSGFSPTSATSKPASLLQARPAVELTLFTQIGKTYRLQYTTDFVSWIDMPGTLEGTGEEIDRIFQQTTTGPRRFWRAVEVE